MTPQTRKQEVKPALINFLKKQKRKHGFNYTGTYTDGKIGERMPTVDVFVEPFGDRSVYVTWFSYGVLQFDGIIKEREIR